MTLPYGEASGPDGPHLLGDRTRRAIPEGGDRSRRCRRKKWQFWDGFRVKSRRHPWLRAELHGGRRGTPLPRQFAECAANCLRGGDVAIPVPLRRPEITEDGKATWHGRTPLPERIYFARRWLTETSRAASIDPAASWRYCNPTCSRQRASSSSIRRSIASMRDGTASSWATRGSTAES